MYTEEHGSFRLFFSARIRRINTALYHHFFPKTYQTSESLENGCYLADKNQRAPCFACIFFYHFYTAPSDSLNCLCDSFHSEKVAKTYCFSTENEYLCTQIANKPILL